MTRIEAFVLDSGTGQVARLQAPLLASGRGAAAEYHEAIKALTDAPSRGSKRLRQKIGVQIDGVACAARPFDFALYAYAATVNTYHARAVRAKAKDVVGRPWQIVGDGPERLRRRIEEFFANAFGRESFSTGMRKVWTDYEALGNGYLEVIPNKSGEPAELAHVPAPEMWVRLDGLGYVQQKASQFAHFRVFGAGEEDFADLNDKDPIKSSELTSVIHFSRYSPWSPYYGIPSIMPAWNAVVLMTLVAEYNLQFFSNNAIPDYAVILEGETEDDTIQVIQEYFRTHLKGKAHKTLCLQTPSGAKIRFEKLTSDAAKEASFRLLRMDCRDEIIHAHGVPPQKVGIVETGKLGGNLATEQREEYKTSIIAPSQEAIQSQFDRLIRIGFGTDAFHFEFEPYDTEDRRLNAETDAVYLDRGVLTPNEVRANRFPDLDPLEGGDEPLTAGAADPLLLEDTLRDMQRTIREAARK